MNKLDRPAFFDDHAALEALANNPRVGSYPHLRDHILTLRAAYDQYVAANGNVSAIAKVQLPKEVEKILLGHYASPPDDVSHIPEIRRQSAADTCPMCGSLHSGTLDHIMPKVGYPAFAIFGLNLVPACKCNSLRSNELTGAAPGERILHPYFDDVLRERILVAHFEDLGSAPSITVQIALGQANPHIAAVRFHYENVVKRTSIQNRLIKMWAKLVRTPSLMATDLRHNPPSRDALVDILERELERCDEFFESKNNWHSVFLSGLLAPPVVNWLYQRFSRPGRVPDSPLDP